MAKKRFLSSDDGVEQLPEINSVNAKNQQEFQNLIDNRRRKYNDYWDINNPVIRIILIVLFVIIVIEVLYYIILWFR